LLVALQLHHDARIHERQYSGSLRAYDADLERRFKFF